MFDVDFIGFAMVIIFGPTHSANCIPHNEGDSKRRKKRIYCHLSVNLLIRKLCFGCALLLLLLLIFGRVWLMNSVWIRVICFVKASNFNTAAHKLNWKYASKRCAPKVAISFRSSHSILVASMKLHHTHTHHIELASPPTKYYEVRTIDNYCYLCTAITITPQHSKQSNERARAHRVARIDFLFALNKLPSSILTTFHRHPV